MHNLGWILQPMTVGTTTGGGGILGMLSAYGVEILIGAILMVLALIGISFLRRTKANSRGNEKKF